MGDLFVLKSKFSKILRLNFGRSTIRNQNFENTHLIDTACSDHILVRILISDSDRENGPDRAVHLYILTLGVPPVMNKKRPKAKPPPIKK